MNRMKDNKKNILYIIFFNIIIVISELFFGFISNSYSLISDAFHNFGDVISLIITYITLNMSILINRKASQLNMVFLYITMIYILFESINKLVISEQYSVSGEIMIVVGFIALVANGVSSYYLLKMNVSKCNSHKHTLKDTNNNKEKARLLNSQQKENINSAYLHMLSDAYISVGVIVGGLMIYIFNIYYIDLILTIFFSIYIMVHSFESLKTAFNNK